MAMVMAMAVAMAMAMAVAMAMAMAMAMAHGHGRGHVHSTRQCPKGKKYRMGSTMKSVLGVICHKKKTHIT